MAMFSSWISKGAEVITNSARSMTSHSNPAADSTALLKQLLTKIQIHISKQLGENCQSAFQSIAADIIKQQELEKQVIETKEKYHHLVTQSELQQESIRTNFHFVVQLLRDIASSLKSEDIVTPLKDLETAFYQCNSSKLQKHIKYYWKLYEAALGDYLKANVTSRTDQCKDEINLFKGLNKNLEVELFRSRNACADLEARLNQMHSKNAQMTERLSILQKLGMESAILTSNKQKQKAQQRENQLLDRIRALQKEKTKLERIFKETTNQLQKSNASITVMKQNQEKIIQEMQAQITKKEGSYQASMSKVCMEKIHLEQRIKSLLNSIELLQQQVITLKMNQNTPKKDTRNAQIKQLNQKVTQLQQKLNQCNTKLQTMVSKDIMRTLFLSFEDESKEWTVRRDVRNQIHLLLGIKSRQEPKPEDRKWFGIF